MILRFLGLLLALSLGGAWGAFNGSVLQTLLGVLAAAVLWLVWDTVAAARLLRWLSRADAPAAPRLSGLWGELFERTRKRLRVLELKGQSSDGRLQDFLAALQASPNGVVLLDAQSRIEWSNLTAQHHLGLDPERDLGQYVRNLVRHPAFTAYMDSGDFGREIEIDGAGQSTSQPHKISLQVHPYGDQRQLMLTRDVTAVQLAEAMRRDFVANVSHEIRTPLTVLSGFVETMQSLSLDEEERQRFLALMSQQALRMQTLVNDLLTLSRLEGSPAPGIGEWTDVGEWMQQLVQDARGLSAAIASPVHDIALEMGPSLQVAGSRHELYSAVSNLVSNAVRYTPPGGRIRAGWRSGPDGVCEFFVNDTGPGIAPEHLPRLTERFYRVDRSRSRETGGTGLGLAIVKHVAQRHGGQVYIRSAVGQGSTFAISLPASRLRPMPAASVAS
ncbi:phosphate regulon sensor histidine kinase PhoR [Hydrogenophaga sp. RWCD_12]|uniref:phosphate regulon sensor histidine kinase PhoR n=1 Tax=Hydrogenophaga sp. RWCD_12 TaxID=3391190 RepID=UPI0039852C14